MMIQIEHTIQLEDESERDFTFEFEFSEGSEETRDEPGYPDSLEFFAAYDEDGEEIDFSDKVEIENATQRAWESLSD